MLNSQGYLTSPEITVNSYSGNDFNIRLKLQGEYRGENGQEDGKRSRYRDFLFCNEN